MKNSLLWIMHHISEAIRTTVIKKKDEVFTYDKSRPEEVKFLEYEIQL